MSSGEIFREDLDPQSTLQSTLITQQLHGLDELKRQNPDEYRDTALQRLTKMQRGQPGESADAWNGYNQIAPYLLELNAVSSTNPEVQKIWWQTAIAASASGDYSTSLLMCMAAHEEWEEGDDARRMTSQIGLILTYLGKPEIGISYLEDAYESHLFFASSSVEDRLWGNALFDRIAFAEAAAGNAEEALIIHRQAHENAQALKNQHPDNKDVAIEVCRTAGNIAAQLLAMGEYNEALALSSAAADGRIALKGEDNRLSYNAKLLHGQALRLNNHLPEAIAVLTQTAEGLIRITGENHHDSQKALSELRAAINLFELSGNTLEPEKLTPKLLLALGRLVCNNPSI